MVPIFRLDYSEKDIKFILRGIEEVLRSGYLTMDRRVREFEEAFAAFCGVKYAVGTNSGTSSIEIALRAIDVDGGTVVMPSNTYMATPLAAIKAGARVVFTECDAETLQMDPADLKKKIREDTRAVIVVHIGGIISPEIERIKAICDERDLPLIEDAAHAHGAEAKGKRAGNIGLAGSFSFYPTKVLTTAEGGMLTTNDRALYEKAKVLREHGKACHRLNVHTEIGDNWRCSEIHAVLGIQQMRKADAILKARRQLASMYDDRLGGNQLLETLRIPLEIKPSYYKYITMLAEHLDRNEVKCRMKEDYGIELPGEVYSDPCHSQPVFRKYPKYLANGKEDKFPVTERICRRQLCLPLYPGLTNEELDYVVISLGKLLAALDRKYQNKPSEKFQET